ncbi:hypothetical protein Krac_12395 [Ktedonobacter racemifer DSM 44963]|uniref:Uncharacterized protein n=1 Tax=Ktedonobacter racemifer DSM 44963 TaxID=485913 RepID=D6TGP8_KTERA|nr:hypothetical protein Krac_12395 [Ktedonobacter racemifer DSM 44963]
MMILWRDKQWGITEIITRRQSRLSRNGTSQEIDVLKQLYATTSIVALMRVLPERPYIMGFDTRLSGFNYLDATGMCISSDAARSYSILNASDDRASRTARYRRVKTKREGGAASLLLLLVTIANFANDVVGEVVKTEQ